MGGLGRKTGLDACKFMTLRSDLPDGADTRYREEAFTKNKTKPTFCGHWWNVLASLPRHLTLKAQVPWELPGSPSRSPCAPKAMLTHPTTGILHWRNQEGRKISHLYFENHMHLHRQPG